MLESLATTEAIRRSLELLFYVKNSAMNNASFQAILDPPENVLLFDRIGTTPKEPEWIFDGLWQARTFALFTGDGALGKSHFTFQLAVAIASGARSLERPFAVQNRESLFTLRKRTKPTLLLRRCSTNALHSCTNPT